MHLNHLLELWNYIVPFAFGEEVSEIGEETNLHLLLGVLSLSTHVWQESRVGEVE